MILVWWEHMAETGWYTNTFKSLARQLLCRDRSVQLCVEADTAGVFGITAVQSQKSLLPAWSHPWWRILSFAQGTRTKVLLQHSIISKELKDDAFLGKPRKNYWATGHRPILRPKPKKKVLVEGKLLTHTATCVQTLYHTYQHMPKKHQLLLTPGRGW